MQKELFTHRILKRNYCLSQGFSIIVLMCAMLFSFIAHGEHDEINGENAEQHCQICQQHVDKDNNKIDISHSFISCYIGYAEHVYVLTYHANYFITPPLRAPPA